MLEEHTDRTCCTWPTLPACFIINIDCYHFLKFHIYRCPPLIKFIGANKTNVQLSTKESTLLGVRYNIEVLRSSKYSTPTLQWPQTVSREPTKLLLMTVVYNTVGVEYYCSVLYIFRVLAFQTILECPFVDSTVIEENRINFLKWTSTYLNKLVYCENTEFTKKKIMEFMCSKIENTTKNVTKNYCRQHAVTKM